MKKSIIYIIAYLFIQVVCTVPFMLYAAYTQAGHQMTATQLVAASAVSNVVAVAVFSLRKWYPLSFEYIKTRPWVTLYWTLIMSLGMIIPATLLEQLIPEAMTQDILNMSQLLSTPWAIVALCIMAPIAEEVVCRGAIQTALVQAFSVSRMSDNSFLATPVRRRWMPLILTALIFSAIHGNPAQMPHAFLIGLLLSWLAYRSGSIIPGILMHTINNSTAFVLYMAYPQSVDMKLIEFFGNSWLRLGGATALSLLLFVPAVLQLNKHLSRTYNR